MSGIVCLLPVRNGEQDLPGYLEAAPAWCDAIVALDDGSTDGTRALLEASPLVRIVLANPPRPTAAGWHDGENRGRLLEAAAELEPAWVLFVDADERIEAEDAEALRALLATDALPGVVYGFRHVRAWGNGFDPREAWVYRLFAWRPELRTPDRRLHFDPVPTAIPRRAWVRTSLRIQHLGAATEERRAERLRKYRETDPEGEFGTNFGWLDEVPERAVPWEARDPSAPIVLPPEGSTGSIFEGTSRKEGRVICLLPARNCEADLPGFFASAARVADAVVALDDGSTDATRQALEREPLVEVLLTRPKRPDHAGWDDAANRQALLDAAEPLEPAWILFLDADERLDPDDAAALRAFLAEEAVPGRAYGFRVHRMVGDLEHYDRADLVAYRLFAWEPGLRLPQDRLHLVPVPSSIPRASYVPTTVRIQHLASLTVERRRARFEKYREADPELEFQPDYGDLLAPPEEVRAWEPRPPGLPVLQNDVRAAPPPPGGATLGVEELALALQDTDLGLDLDAPVLSAVVIAREDEERIERVVRSVVEQDCPESFEVIVVVSGSDRTADIVRERFPGVTLVELDRPALPGAARNAGLAVARGDYVSFPGSHVVLPQGSLAERVRAHQLGFPMVTGTMLNATDTPAGWASYLLDHSSALPERPSGELGVAPAHCSYDREILLRVGGFPEDLRAGEDTVVNTELFRRGYRAFRAAGVRLFHESPCTTPARLLRHHFQRGRGLGRIVLESVPPGGRALTGPSVRRLLVAYVPRRISVVRSHLARWGDDGLRGRYREVRPLVAAGAVSAWVGTWTELLRPSPGKLGTLLGTPAVHVAVAGLDRRPGFPVGRADALLVVRAEPFHGRVRVLSIPRDLVVELPGVGERRLNEIYYVGASRGRGPGGSREGMRWMRAALRHPLGIAIHGSVVVDLEGFARLVDALGGVEVDVPHSIDDEFTGEDGEVFSAHFAAGRQRLDGAAALTYARTTRADGDRWRRQRHADLLLALARAAASTRSPERAIAAARAALGSVRTDLGPLRTAGVLAAAWRARRKGFDVVHVAPPIVRSERTDAGWVTRADLPALWRFVRERWVARTRATSR